MKSLGMKRRVQMLPISLMITLSFALSLSANALTYANVTGSGDLIVSVRGVAYLDTSALDLTDLTLFADGSIFVGSAFPNGVPGTATDTIDLRGIIGTTELSILDDAYFDDFAFAGSLTIEADHIRVVGPLMASGPIRISSPIVQIDSELMIGRRLSGDPCSAYTSGASLVITSGNPNLIHAECSPGTITRPDGGPIFIPDGGLIISRAVPEPSSALVFTVCIASFAAWSRRR